MKRLIFTFSVVVFLCISGAVSAQDEKNIGINVGQYAPEIDLATPDGEEITLSSLTENLVLIDFWAADCVPCRKNISKLVPVYRDYHNKNFVLGDGFEVFSVFIGDSKEEWKKAIEKDNIASWINVSDLKHWHSPYVRLYSIKGMPANYLVDQDGVIIAKNLYGKKLKNTLEKYVLKDQIEKLKHLQVNMEKCLIQMKENADYQAYDKEISEIQKQLDKLNKKIIALDEAKP
ncbi:MAG: TlpA disulfide reductase family protein [Bacteroidota bacterium]|nr:TlpA disulfide reductase family protein [Bacteroidota bacterium]